MLASVVTVNSQRSWPSQCALALLSVSTCPQLHVSTVWSPCRQQEEAQGAVCRAGAAGVLGWVHGCLRILNAQFEWRVTCWPAAHVPAEAGAREGGAWR